MDSKRTPGPWEWQSISDAYKEEAGHAYIVGANLGGLVGAALPWLTELDTGDFSRVEANARLIAAAPELLAALKAMLPEANRIDEHLRPSFETCEAARAAIAKAEGK